MTAFGNGTSITGKALNTAFKDIQGQIDSLTATPVGSLIMFGGLGNAIPASFLLCDGASLSTTTYASLFAVVGYTYGGSGGSFNLPNLVGSYVALGTSSTSASSGVRAGVSLTSGNTSVDHSHANTANATVTMTNNNQSANHHHANGAALNANIVTTISNNSEASGHVHTITMTNANQSAFHTHGHGDYSTGGTVSDTHTHGYFKPNGSGANNNTNAAAGGHFHMLNGGTSTANATLHYHNNSAAVTNTTVHSHANTASTNTPGVTMNNNAQVEDHSHANAGASAVTMTNANQSVTHTHASATGALVCFIIKYQ